MTRTVLLALALVAMLAVSARAQFTFPSGWWKAATAPSGCTAPFAINSAGTAPFTVNSGTAPFDTGC